MRKLKLWRSQEGTRCTGHCCRRFYLPHPPEVIQEDYEHWLKHGWGRFGEDIATVGPMLIYLNESRIGVAGDVLDHVGYFYTCKHFNTETHDCAIYNERPSMCARYPYGTKCLYVDCTMTGDVGVVKPEKYSGGRPVGWRFRLRWWLRFRWYRFLDWLPWRRSELKQCFPKEEERV